MSYNKNSLTAAPLVAKALGRSLGVKVIVNSYARTASTDGKVITLPLLPLDASDDLNTLLWGFIHHEAGHVRHTDFSVLEDPAFEVPVVCRLWNALEDIRMERAHIALYPGASASLDTMVSVLVKIGFFQPVEVQDSTATAFHAYVLYYLRSSALNQSAITPLVATASDFLSNSLGEGFVTRLAAELSPIHDASCSADCLDLAMALHRFIETEQERSEDQQADQNQTDDDEASGQSASDDDDGSDDSSNDDCASTSSDDTSPDSDNSVDDDSVSQKDVSDSSDDSSDDSGDSPGSSKGDESESQSANGASESNDGTLDPNQAFEELLNSSEIPDHLGDLGEALKQVIGDEVDSEPSSRVNLPESDVLSSAQRDAGLVETARTVSSRVAIQLKRSLESRKMSGSVLSKRGNRIDQRALVRVAFNDNRVFRKKVQTQALNTAVVMLLDRSSSMDRIIELALSTSLAASLALDTLHDTEHVVAAFPSPEGYQSITVLKGWHERSESVSSRFSVNAGGGTPLASSLLWSANELVKRTESRRVVIVATDGDPDCVESCLDVLVHLKKLDVEVHGLGICHSDMHNLFDTFSEVNDLDQLPSAFLGLFNNVLRKSA